MPYVWSRNGAYQFRRRLPKKLTELGAPTFLCLSLRTEVLPEAMKRAAAIIAAMELVEAEVTSMNLVREVTPEALTLIVREVARAALDEIVRRDAMAGVRSEAEADAARGRVEHEIARLKASSRLRDGQPARDATREAMATLHIPGAGDAPALVEREALGALIEVRTSELAFEEGQSLEQATRVLRERHFSGQPLDRIKPPIMLSDAVAAAHRTAVSIDMARKIEATGACAIAFRGDMPLDLFLERENFLAFLMWLRRLPKVHGKDHGRNRYSKEGCAPDKHQAIADADERDFEVTDEVRARRDLDQRSKRAELARRLTVRLSDATVEKHHARVSAIAAAARNELGWAGPDFVPVLKEFRRRAATADNRAPDPLALRVTATKKRSVWSLERMDQLFTSPIYTGCFSQHRRWRRGRMIIRDGFYWLPLIQLTMGPRPEEAAALPKDAVQVRDGIACIRFEKRPDARLKNEESERLVPIPEILLRLGFLEWWRAQLALPGYLLFPEFPASEVDGKVSGIFGKRRVRIYDHIGIRDAREDFYAGRMTVSTQLLTVGAPDHVRQSILGHEHNAIINRHYTEANLALMKDFLDRIDLGLTVEHDERHRFPVIRACTLLKERPLAVTLTLDAGDRPKCIEVHEPSTGVTHVIMSEFEFDPKDWVAVALNLEQMGRRLNALLAGRRYRIEGEVDQIVERNLGMLLAVGYSSASAARRPEPTPSIGLPPDRVSQRPPSPANPRDLPSGSAPTLDAASPTRRRHVAVNRHAVRESVGILPSGASRGTPPDLSP